MINNYGHRGILSFRIRSLLFALNVQFHAPPNKFSSHNKTRVTLTFASKRVKQRNVGACFGWTEIFPSLCQNGDLLAHDVYIDKPKAWCQQKRA